MYKIVKQACSLFSFQLLVGFDFVFTSTPSSILFPLTPPTSVKFELILFDYLISLRLVKKINESASVAFVA